MDFRPGGDSIQQQETVAKDIGLYKSRILTPIQDSEDIKDLLLIGEEYSDELWYGRDENPDDTGIVYKQIFPYLYIDDTQTTVESYICYEVDIPNVQSKTVKDMKVIIWCICHRDAMKCSKKGYLGTRVDKLADAVERALRNYEIEMETKGKSAYGIGKLQLKSILNLTNINKDYYGRQLIFTTADFKMKGK